MHEAAKYAHSPTRPSTAVRIAAHKRFCSAPVPCRRGPAPHRLDDGARRDHQQGGRTSEQCAAFSSLLMVVISSAAWLGCLLLGSVASPAAPSSACFQVRTVRSSSPPGSATSTASWTPSIALAPAFSSALSTAEALMREMAEGKHLRVPRTGSRGRCARIRDPIAAMRLKAENTVAAGPTWHAKIERSSDCRTNRALEALLQNLLVSGSASPPRDRGAHDITAFTRRTRGPVPRTGSGAWCDARGQGVRRRDGIRSAADRPSNRQPHPQRDPEYAVRRARDALRRTIKRSAGLLGGR